MRRLRSYVVAGAGLAIMLVACGDLLGLGSEEDIEPVPSALDGGASDSAAEAPAEDSAFGSADGDVDLDAGSFGVDACAGKDLSSDPSHCGACFAGCLKAQSCVDGGCVADPCDAGKGCATNAGFVCVDVQTNPSHCGACGHTCNFPSCAGGECERLVFVTSQAYKVSDIGGPKGAVDKCQAEVAGAAKKTVGQFLPWMSVGTKYPANLFVQGKRAYRLAPVNDNNTPIVAASFSDLVDGKLTNPIARDISGAPVAPVQAWTNTKADGTPGPTAAPCMGWTSPTGSVLLGNTSQTDSTWTAQLGSCSSVARIYCFEQ